MIGTCHYTCLQSGRPGLNPWVRKISWRRTWQSTPVFLLGESCGFSVGLQLQSTGFTKSRTRLSDWTELNCVWFSATPWTVARQGPLSMRFSRQEHWRGLPFPPPGALPVSSSALAGGFLTLSHRGHSRRWEAQSILWRKGSHHCFSNFIHSRNIYSFLKNHFHIQPLYIILISQFTMHLVSSEATF